MKGSISRLNKRFVCIFFAIIVIFNTFYFDYKKSYAMSTTVVMGLTVEECLMYLAGLCGVGFAGAYISGNPLSESDKAIFKQQFEQSCQTQSISQAEMIEWETQLLAGQLDKASDCWHVFLDSISESIMVPDPTIVDYNGMLSVESVLDSCHYVYDDYKVNLSFNNLAEMASAEGYPLPSSCDVIQISYYVNMDDQLVLSLYFAEFSDYYDESLYFSDSVPYQGVEEHYGYFYRAPCYQFKFSRAANSQWKLVRFSDYYNSSNLIGMSKSFNGDLIYNCPVVYSSSATYELPYSRASINANAIYDGWSNVLDNGNTLSDAVDIIGAGDVADTDVITLPWDNVSDGTGHLADKWERLWEKVAVGEITWEQFIEALQEGVGVITLEKEVVKEWENDDSVPDSVPIVIEKELVPDVPDKPQTKDEIYQDNVVNGSLTFDLSDVFPFCIPWDIYNLFSYLNQKPVAPKFAIPIPSYDRSGNLTLSNTITIDLSIFDSVALVFRVCIFLIFCLGLMLATRSLIRG